MKWWIYNGLFAVAYLAMMPAFLLRMKRRGGYRARMGDRFGRYPASVLAALRASRGPVWIHAVSVGEVQVAGQLLAEMRRVDPDLRCVFSTTSSTGWKTAEKLVGPQDVLIYNPLDFNGCVRRALDRIRPRAVILTETEIWPNFLRALKRRGVPVCLVNARISDRSAPRYAALRWFFGEAFRCFTKIYAQSDLDATRLTAAGADPAAIAVTGSVKFDVAKRNPAKEGELRAWIGPGEILLGGSTWPGEDRVLLETYAELRRTRPDVRLVIAPRHFEKADAVEANIRAAGFACIRRSRGEAAVPGGVFLCDTTGEMMGLFGIATVAFVGKSLCAHGSQNMIEPCLCGVPTVVGPYTENFRPVMSDLLAADALVQTPEAGDPAACAAAVRAALLRFFAEPDAARAYAARARAAVVRRQGATARIARELCAAFPAASPAVPPRAGRFLRTLALVAGAYLLSALFVTPALARAWQRVRLDPNRRYGTFVTLSAVTALYPWCLPGAYRTYREITVPPEVPGADEEGVMRYACVPALHTLLPKLFPDCRAVPFDARRRSFADLRTVHDALRAKGGDYRLWCLGRWDYLFLVPESGTNAAVRADAFAAAFSADFEAFAAAGFYSPPELLACYLGDAREIGPALETASPHPAWSRFVQRLLPGRFAFRPAPEGGREPVRPSRLTPLEEPSFAWLKRGKCDAGVYLDLLDRASVAQRARRDLLMGIDFAEAGGYLSTNAIPLWTAAAAASPRDPMLRNLADTLDLQGRRFLALGNVRGAMACYENRILVQPHDVAAIHNFGVCLRRAGQFDFAAQVFLKAAQSTADNEPHLLALADCAAAAGHPDDALKTLEMLKTRTRGPVAELDRRIRKIRAEVYRRNIKEYYR